jgi:hypothetical protein
MSRKTFRRTRFRNEVWGRANRLYWNLRNQGVPADEALRRHDAYMAAWGVPLVPEVVARLEAERARLSAEREAREGLRPLARESARRALRAAEDTFAAARLRAWRHDLSLNQPIERISP